ncbi:MAG: hypothetical protein D6702_00860 [Planctomycetota bacterium]|nr:MAG: hypothetical protein D6702_00860 [Planctomycetota bacterium]
MRLLHRLTTIVGLAALMPSLGAWAGGFWWRFLLWEHLRLFWAVGLAVALVGALLARRRRWAAFWAGASLLNGVLLLPLLPFPFRAEAAPAGPVLRLAHANLQVSNPEPERALAWLTRLDRDWVLLEECSPEWLRRIEAAGDRWEVAAADPKGDPTGIALLAAKEPAADSGWRLAWARVVQMSPTFGDRPAIEALFQGAGREVVLLGFHAQRPVSETESLGQAEDYAWAEAWARRQLAGGREPVILGDFNSTPWASRFRRLRRRAGLRDSLAGRGLQGSWPVALPGPLRLPIDHALVGPGLRVLERRLGPEIGSDHLPLLLTVALGPVRSAPRRAPFESTAGSSFRALARGADGSLWAGGSGGVLLRSADGGRSWERLPAPAAADGSDFDFRDLAVFAGGEVLALACGPGSASRVFRSVDGGRSWQEALRNPDSAGFFDGFAFWPDGRGLLYGDPVDGVFAVWRSPDRGRSWERVPPTAMPAALPGEHGFAASGGGIAVAGEDRAWFVTGGEAVRVFRSADGGRSWQAAELPLARGPASAGAFAVAFDEEGRGIAVGGDSLHPARPGRIAAWSGDGGDTWRPLRPRDGFFLSGVVCAPGGGFVAVGPVGGLRFDARGEELGGFLPGGNVLLLGEGGRRGWVAGPAGILLEIPGRTSWAE